MTMEIERAVVINLDRDSKRLHRFYQALPADWPFPKPMRFSAWDGSRIPAPPWWVAGDAAWGCFRSHQFVIEQAINDQVQSLLVMEDDAFCHPEFSGLFQRFAMELPSDWQWVYLGGQHIQRERGLPIPITEHVYRPFNVHRSHAYALRGATAMQRVVAHLHDRDSWGEKHHIDHRFGEMHATLDAGLYCPDRWLIGQEAGYSNIKRKHVEANFFPDARSFYDLQIDRPVVVVVGMDRKHRLIVAAILHRMGISFGNAPPPGSIDQALDSYCAPGLDTVCNHLVVDPVQHLVADEAFRICHLKMWADRRLKSANPKMPIGATQPKLALMHREIRSAWPQAIFIVVHVENPRPPVGLDAVHHRRAISAMGHLQQEANCHRVNGDDFKRPDQLVHQLAEMIAADFSASDIATAKQFAIELCRQVEAGGQE
ncbi:Glycosyl transferase, family 25 [Rhodopirellula islandica]|uniref:Glycosyl transferase, family 25 n=1 Tax=Rhodopirellula islandica TaxID=595434 RepID=A0A0J1BL24_RHOIS|nr:glycosyltransferase family 25 protein [Rhodopirellula islandica]KLU07231.1 Glycosyl transferase, family 25 [Rhodopirellula islandica]